MERAEPAIVFTAASRPAAVRSASFALAMSSSCLRVTLPTFSVFGRLEPDWTPAAFFNSTVAGVLLVMKVKVRSEYAVMMTGVGRPGSSFCVAALNRSEEHTSELQSLMRTSYAVFCLKQKKNINHYRYCALRNKLKITKLQ